MKSFDDALQEHKNNMIENLSQFNEGHRVRSLLMDIESNKSDYEYYFNAGQQSKQAEVDELKRKLNEIVILVRDNTPDYYLDNMIDEILKGDSYES